MTDSELLKKVDHTMLKPTATWEQIKKICDESIEYETASVCIPPTYIERVKREYADRVRICTVIGFPLGYSTTECKVYEARVAIKNGAWEVDMVINQGWVKDGMFDEVTKEIAAVKKAAGQNILKVIIEICNLSESEIAKVADCVTEAEAEYIKTSTGFGSGGATFEGVKLMSDSIGPRVKIKAAGGIRTRDDMEKFVELGCERLGTSSAIAILYPEKQ
ncbi:MAG: deoxyribose-phosphate aldolase [Oscillospiraceae bacterium]